MSPSSNSNTNVPVETRRFRDLHRKLWIDEVADQLQIEPYRVQAALDSYGLVLRKRI